MTNYSRDTVAKLNIEVRRWPKGHHVCNIIEGFTSSALLSVSDYWSRLAYDGRRIRFRHGEPDRKMSLPSCVSKTSHTSQTSPLWYAFGRLAAMPNCQIRNFSLLKRLHFRHGAHLAYTVSCCISQHFLRISWEFLRPDFVMYRFSMRNACSLTGSAIPYHHILRFAGNCNIWMRQLLCMWEKQIGFAKYRIKLSVH